MRGFLIPLLTTPAALAHHDVGHGPSEGIRTIQAQGGNPLPRQRLALVAEASRSSDEPSLNAATTHGLSSILSVRALPRLFINAHLPLVLVDEDAEPGKKAGLGNVLLEAQASVGSFKSRDAASWVVGLSVSFPTRTIRFEADPGRQWLLTPSLRYADTYRHFLWYAQLLLPWETRPAGAAIDASPVVGAGYRLFDRLTFTLGTNADIRALTICKTFDGQEVCQRGRATESNRPVGAFRLYGHSGLAADVNPSTTVFFGAQFPLTRRRDIEWSMSLGGEVRF